ncbi:hypothetical protein [Verminephrobacter aporrectodeae]|nr:hypothetical protein [Verminephrobacter aporrectodeae]
MIYSTFSVRSGAFNSDIIKSCLALLYLGKNNFDASKPFRNNALRGGQR